VNGFRNFGDSRLVRGRIDYDDEDEGKRAQRMVLRLEPRNDKPNQPKEAMPLLRSLAAWAALYYKHGALNRAYGFRSEPIATRIKGKLAA